MKNIKAHITIKKKLFAYTITLLFMQNGKVLNSSRNKVSYCYKREDAVNRVVDMMEYVKDSLLFKEGEVAIFNEAEHSLYDAIIDEVENRQNLND